MIIIDMFFLMMMMIEGSYFTRLHAMTTINAMTAIDITETCIPKESQPMTMTLNLT